MWRRKWLNLGANGLVLFNRLYQPDFDIERLQITSDLKLSEPNEIRLPLLWIAALYGRLGVSLAATTGVQGGNEVVKYLLAGADVVMTASALYKHGIQHLRTMHNELHGLDGEKTVSDCGCVSRHHEPAEHRGYIRLRTRQLH